MNLSKDIAAQVDGLEYEKLNAYLRARREQLRDNLEDHQDDWRTTHIRGQLFALTELLKLQEAVRISLASENNH